MLSIKELSDLLVSLFPDKKLKVEQNIPDSNYLVSKVRFNVPDTKNLKKLGWVPKINPEKGFKRFIIGIESKIK